VKKVKYEVQKRLNDDGLFGRKYEKEKGVKENNDQGSDLPNLELKSKKPGSKSRDTLFSKEPKWDTSGVVSRSKDLLDLYKNTDGKLNTTMTYEKPNKVGFYISNSIDAEHLYVYHTEHREPIGRYVWSEILSTAATKLKNVNKAVFHDEKRYTENKYRGFSSTKFRSLLQEGGIVVEFRMRVGKNRGTAFRVNQDRLKELYATATEN
jgi:hypothetical protein